MDSHPLCSTLANVRRMASQQRRLFDLERPMSCPLAGIVLAVISLGLALDSLSEIARIRRLCRAERQFWLK